MTIRNALQQLRQQLTHFTDAKPGFSQLSVPLSAECDSLTWLGAQPVWPQFYWQHRQENRTLAACGAILKADSPARASRLLAALPAGMALTGVNDFALARSFLFLPRLFIHNAVLHINLHDENALCDDAQRAIAFIDALRAPRPLAPLPVSTGEPHHQPDNDAWHRLIARALEAIARGEMAKVVLARATDVPFADRVSAASALAASRLINPHCYHYLLAFNAQQAFIGSSPERLYHRHSTQLVTEALAGTCPSADEPERARQFADALLRDEKNQRENRLVVDDICQRLQPIAGEATVRPVKVVTLRNVQHLRRIITAELHEPDDELCLAQLQPTAAVAGLPRASAKRFIAQHESFAREWYAGSVGYLSAEESELAVALRCAAISGRQVRFYAGAGIVAGSQPAAEWQEINHKVAAMGALFGVDFTP